MKKVTIILLAFLVVVSFMDSKGYIDKTFFEATFSVIFVILGIYYIIVGVTGREAFIKEGRKVIENRENIKLYKIFCIVLGALIVIFSILSFFIKPMRIILMIILIALPLLFNSSIKTKKRK